MILQNFICNSYSDCDFVHWQGKDKYHVDDDDKEESDERSSDNDHGGHIPYEPTSDRAMKNLRDTITSTVGRRQ